MVRPIRQAQGSPQVVRVRIAPSPTGIPHIGNTRTALFNFLFARHNKGKFILRIEDTDRVRYVSGSEKAICEILEWLGLLWDEKYVQSGRLDIYREHADKLLKNDMAYKDEGAIRFRMPKEGKTSWADEVGKKTISFENKTQEDFVILKSDGFPTYNFANVVDDHLMEITHVIRGDEFISSTPKHIQLYKAFDWKPPVFAHLPVILGPDRQKLSKRHGAESVLYYRGEGYLKEALLNFMALLGWNPGGDREILSLSKMIQLFDLKDVNTASPVFDIKKLGWMNGHYIRQLPAEKLKSKIKNHKQSSSSTKSKSQIKIQNFNEKLPDRLVELAQTRMRTLNDFYDLVIPWFEPVNREFTDREKEIARVLMGNLERLNSWRTKDIHLKIFNSIAWLRITKKINVGFKDIYKILINDDQGLPIAEMLEILGKEKALKRLKGGV